MKKIYLFAAATLALASCTGTEDDPVIPTEALNVSATIGESISRASDNTWDAGDRIGIISTVGNVAGPFINLEYVTPAGDGNFKGTPVYFYKPMTLVAYYPFTGQEGTDPGLIDAVTLPYNQTEGKQLLIDFLWDSKTNKDDKDFSATNNNINFNLSHKMSKVTFTFQSSEEVWINGVKFADGVDVGKMVSYSVNGMVMEGRFDTATGVCSVKPGATPSDFVMNVNNVEHNQPQRPHIFFPQKLKDGYAELHIYTDELNNHDLLQHYICKLMFTNGEIKSGYHYKYTIRVTKTGLIVGEMTVEPWEEEDRFMTATIDKENVFDEP